MSNITNIFNRLISICQATLPAYHHLSDGLEPNQNNVLELDMGFSVTASDASSGPVQYGCQVQLVERNYTVALTNIYNKRSDPVGRDQYELNLMEDLFLLTKAIINDQTMGGSACGVDFSGDIGPQYLDSERQEFLYTDATFNIKYEESLT